MLTCQKARGCLRSEEAERSMAIASIRRRLGVATVKAQTDSLLGRLQWFTQGPMPTVSQTRELERQWAREERAMELASRQVFRAFRTGFAMLD